MDMKGAFDYISQSCLLRTMDDVGAEEDLVRMREIFMTDKSVSLVINDQHCAETEVQTGVPQGSQCYPSCLQYI